MRSPFVSVLINNHNYGRFLSQAIESLFNQTYNNFEIIVVDDGSTDNSEEIVDSYGEKVISIFKPNGGQDSAFNVGFERSRGDIICFLDADDVFVPIKLAQVVEAFRHHPQAEWCFHSLLLKDVRTQQPLGRTRAFPRQLEDKSTDCDFRQGIRWGWLPFYPASTSGLCFRRRLLGRILPMPETFVPTSADRYVRMAALGLSPGFYIAQDLTIQGIHGSNVCTMNESRPFLLERQLVTSYLLRSQFPQLALYTNRMFARGLCAYNRLRPSDRHPEYDLFIQRYRQLCSPVDRLLISLLLSYHSRPWRKEYSFRSVGAESAQMQEAISAVR